MDKFEALTRIEEQRTRGAPSSRANDYLMRVVLRGLKHEQETLEVLINSTPSGDRRNVLCDANIHLGKALMMLEGLK